MPTAAPVVTNEYVNSLSPIYQDLFNAFWMFNPNGRPDWGVSVQSLFSVLGDKVNQDGAKYTLGQVREACDELVRGKAMTLEKGIFYHPTELGKAIIASMQSSASTTTTTTPPPFSPPPGY